MGDGERGAQRSEVKAKLNATVLDLAAHLDEGVSDAEPWFFVCECDDLSCRERVQLVAADYVALKDRGEVVLAPGHELSRATRARREAQELRRESQALRAQARLQANRAARLVAGQTVWIGRREATFLYSPDDHTAVIRYEGDAKGRVVFRGRLTSHPPDRS
jgi:hypothetical protein